MTTEVSEWCWLLLHIPVTLFSTVALILLSPGHCSVSLTADARLNLVKNTAINTNNRKTVRNPSIWPDTTDSLMMRACLTQPLTMSSDLVPSVCSICFSFILMTFGWTIRIMCWDQRAWFQVIHHNYVSQSLKIEWIFFSLSLLEHWSSQSGGHQQLNISTCSHHSSPLDPW